MSTFKRSTTDEWSEIWDALYYNFINKHQEIFKKNYAIAQQVKNWNNKGIKVHCLNFDLEAENFNCCKMDFWNRRFNRSQ
jgi:deoxyribodipyrimidine photolyase-like uncharacterized protein